MLLLCVMLLLPLLVATETAQNAGMQEDEKMLLQDTKETVGWIGDGILNFVDNVLPVSEANVEARKRKKSKMNKYLIPLIVGFVLIKSILLPIALKTLAILSSKAVILSLMSLILAAIVGLKKVAQTPSGGNYEVVSVPSSKYRRQDMFDFGEDTTENDPYKFYKERRRKK